MENYKVTIELTKIEVCLIVACCSWYKIYWNKKGIKTPMTDELQTKMKSIYNQMINGPF